MSDTREVIAKCLSDEEIVTGDGALAPESEEWNVATSILSALTEAGFSVVSDDQGEALFRSHVASSTTTPTGEPKP